LIRGIGVLLAVAGVGLWRLSIMQGLARASAEAKPIFDALGTAEEESAQDAAALIQLSHSSRAVRAAFLRYALQSEAAADKVRIHEQGISVALSRVDFSEALVLYQTALLPTLKGSPGPKVVRECFALLSRWSLIGQISPQDASDIASQLAVQLTTRAGGEEDPSALDQFSAALGELAPKLSPESAAVLTRKLFSQAIGEHDPSIIQAVNHSLAALAPRLSPDMRRELASRLVDRLAVERDPSVLMTLGSALSPLSATLNAKTAGELTEKLATRITAEFDTQRLDALDSAFKVVAPRTDPADAQRISSDLLRHVKLEPDPSVLLLDTQALAAFGEQLPSRVYEEAAGTILKRIQAEPNAVTLSVLAYCMGVFKSRAGNDHYFEIAAAEIVSRFVKEREMKGLSALASAIDSVADHLSATEAERLSSLLVDRMLEERDPGSVLYIAVDLESVADEVKGSGGSALAGRITQRMALEHSSHVLRSFAFSVAAFEDATGNSNKAAEVLVTRMSDETDPDELQIVTSGLFALRNKADVRFFDKAAGILAARIQTQLNPGEIRNLVASLHALEAKSSPEPFEQAASAIVANANNLAALEPALRRIGMKLRPPKAEELAAILKAKIAREEDPKALRVLGQALADLPVVSADSDLRRVLAVSQAPCEVSRSAVQLFNPLCSEASWNELAASAAHAKAKPTVDDLEPVFTQLAADDDDAAGDKSTDDAALDFHQLSDAVNGFRPVAQEIRPPMGARWSAIALLVMAAVVLLYSARFGVRHRASAITG
jgi:hypothetical protein